SGNAPVKANGRGDVYMYGEHFRTPEEGNALAKIRAEELLCREKRFFGESTIPFLRPGYLFDLQDHYRSNFNQKYLTIEIEHEGSQTAYLLAGIQKGLSEVEQQPYYRNSFVAMPAEVQFRPEQKTEKAHLYGTMSAKIDAAGSGKYAELDEQGRYKVILPFDLSDRKDGKASAYLRMAQPYAGTDHGMHFPLHKGTEVLLTFIDGDPDRPIIQGAVPNPEMPSQVTSTDQTMSKITTAGGNKIHMEDKEGSERILMHAPKKESFVRIGAPNDPDWHAPWDPDTKKEKTEENYGIHLATSGLYDVTVQAKNEVVLGEETINVLGLHMKNIAGMAVDINIGGSKDIKLLYHNEFKPTRKCFNPEKTEVNLDSTKLIEEQTNIVERVTQASQATTTLIEERIEVVEEEQRVIEEEVVVAIGASRVQEEVESLIGEGNKIAGSITTIAGKLSEIAGEKTEVYGSLARNQLEVTDIAVNRDELVTAITQLAGEKNVISGLINMM
ncbi:MAG: type VI secretion system tip protein VgrG, partial [Pseudomonadota bacterium]